MPGAAEARALLALMLLHDARRDARVDARRATSCCSRIKIARAGTREIGEGLALAGRRCARRPGPVRAAGGDRRVHARGRARRRHRLARRSRRCTASCSRRASVARRRAQPPRSRSPRRRVRKRACRLLDLLETAARWPATTCSPAAARGLSPGSAAAPRRPTPTGGRCSLVSNDPERRFLERELARLEERLRCRQERSPLPRPSPRGEGA